MSYKVIRDALNNVVCYGPNNEHYSPGIPSGATLTIEKNIPPPPPPTDAELNAPILAAMIEADMKIIRSLAENDIPRIVAHNTAQAARRATLKG